MSKIGDEQPRFSLRLLITEKCRRKCRGCCNKNWDLTCLLGPNLNEQYKCIMLTGGEPLLNVYEVKKFICYLKSINSSPIYLYTAYTKKEILREVLKEPDLGITLTLHKQKDANEFIEQNLMQLPLDYFEDRSFRLNVFKGISFPKNIDLKAWKVKKDIVWIKNSALPKDEIFRKLIIF